MVCEADGLLGEPSVLGRQLMPYNDPDLTSDSSTEIVTSYLTLPKMSFISNQIF